MTITLTPAPQSWDGTTVDARAFGGVLIVCTSAPGSAWTIKGSPDNNSDFFTQVASVNNGSSISSEVTIINAIGMYYLGGNQFVELTGGSGGGLFISGLPSANASGAQTPNAFWNEATGAASALTGSGTFTGTARDVGVAAGLGHRCCRCRRPRRTASAWGQHCWLGVCRRWGA